MDLTSQIPFLSLIVIPAVGWLHRQISKLSQESIQQEQQIEALNLYVGNLDKAMARRSEVDVVTAKLDAISDRLSRAEATVDRLRNGTHK